VSKYADGLPLYRQEAIYARDGVELGRSLMAQWMGAVGFHFEPLAAHQAQRDTAVPLHSFRTRTSLARGMDCRWSTCWQIARRSRPPSLSPLEIDDHRPVGRAFFQAQPSIPAMRAVPRANGAVRSTLPDAVSQLRMQHCPSSHPSSTESEAEPV